jgi:hypothetical protein
MRGSHAAASSGSTRRAGSTEVVIEIGQQWPASIWLAIVNMASRTTLAPSPGRRWKGRQWMLCETDRSINACHDGWKSTSSIR